jgi:hypothetical protein
MPVIEHERSVTPSVPLVTEEDDDAPFAASTLPVMARVVLAAIAVLVCCAPARAATTVARSGEFELRARQDGGRLCMTLRRSFCTDLDRGTPIDGPCLPYSGAVTVPCGPRRALAYGRMPDRLPAPRVVLDGGRTVGARVISLRGEDDWVALLPDAGVRGLRAGGHRVPLRLPPASAQCGYTARRSF